MNYVYKFFYIQTGCTSKTDANPFSLFLQHCCAVQKHFRRVSRLDRITSRKAR